MRSLSFRSQLLLLRVTPVLVTTAVLGWLAWRAASEVLRQDAIRSVFQERYGLGDSGETFLADAQGLFITTPKYPGHSGEHRSHSIDARPMLERLSGRDSEVLAPDYRGVEVIHGFRFIEEIGGGRIMAHTSSRPRPSLRRALGGPGWRRWRASRPRCWPRASPC